MYDNSFITSLLVLTGFYFIALLFMKFIWKTTLDDAMRKVNSTLTHEFQSWFKHPQINQYDYYLLPTKSRYDGLEELDKATLNKMFDFLKNYFDSFNFIRFRDSEGLIQLFFDIGYTHIKDTNSLRNTIRIETIKMYQEHIEEFLADDSVYVFPFTDNQMRITVAYNFQGRKLIQSRHAHDEQILRNDINRRDIEE